MKVHTMQCSFPTFEQVPRVISCDSYRYRLLVLLHLHSVTSSRRVCCTCGRPSGIIAVSDLPMRLFSDNPGFAVCTVMRPTRLRICFALLDSGR